MILSTGTLICFVQMAAAVAVRRQPSQVSSDMDTLFQRRVPNIVQTIQGASMIPAWLGNYTNGQFSDVDYSTGCAARRANWPAQNHWLHLLGLSAAYQNLLPPTVVLPDNIVGNASVKTVLSSAMDWWFTNDFTEPFCLDQGGLTNATCPCGTPGLWNPNWFSNVILIPRQATQTCLILNDVITPEQRSRCIEIGERGYGVIDRWVVGIGYITGANTLDISNNGISVGLLRYLGGLEGGEELVLDAYNRIHRDLVIQNAIKADGIRGDGSFGQHLGILYNGNYGKDYTNLVLGLETQASGTKFEAGTDSRSAFETHMDGSRWMIYANSRKHVLHWDFNTIGRFLIFPVFDNQATASIKINLTQVEELGSQWESEILHSFYTDLSVNSTNANAGDLVGNRMFWDNDYMVHRDSNYVSALKMISSRTSNTECINMQNPTGFHLGQGTQYNYVYGDEYEDIQASWNWNLIPGITTDYANTPLICNFTQWGGNETFVGGASIRESWESVEGMGMGVAAMKYLNPYTGAFKYKKAWFFLPGGVEHVIVSGAQVMSSSANWLPGAAGPNADVYSVLDQKRWEGDVYVNGNILPSTGLQNFTTFESLWHNGVGYTFPLSSGPGFQVTSQHMLSVNTVNTTGNWSLIGTSASPPTTVGLFSAWIKHDPATLDTGGVVEYSVYPGTTTKESFDERVAYKGNNVKKVGTDDNIVSAIVDGVDKIIMAVFWQVDGGSFEFPLDLFEDDGYESKGGSKAETLVVKVNRATTVIIDLKAGQITLSDPTQLLKGVITVSLQLKVTKESQGAQWEGLFGGHASLLELSRKKEVKTRLRLPSGNNKGMSVTAWIGKKN